MNKSDTCQGCSPIRLYRKRLRFHFPNILINKKSFNGKLDWVTGAIGHIEEETKYVKWRFCFHAPMNSAAFSWRWAWIKIFGKLWVIRWTLFNITYD